MAAEVARGKAYFPGWNLARWWLSHESFQRNPQRFLANFEAGLSVFAGHGIQVLPVLFNRWRDPICDFGGVPLDHIIPGASSYCRPGAFESLDQPAWTQEGFAELDHDAENVFRAYLDAVVGAHCDDDRILGWDLCNEPLMGPYVDDEHSPIRIGELRWLTWVRDVCRAAGASQPLTIGNYNSLQAVRLTEPLSDFISFHPYYIPNWGEWTTSSKPLFEGFLDEVQEFATERRQAARTGQRDGLGCERRRGARRVHPVHPHRARQARHRFRDPCAEPQPGRRPALVGVRAGR